MIIQLSHPIFSIFFESSLIFDTILSCVDSLAFFQIVDKFTLICPTILF